MLPVPRPGWGGGCRSLPPVVSQSVILYIVSAKEDENVREVCKTHSLQL